MFRITYLLIILIITVWLFIDLKVNTSLKSLQAPLSNLLTLKPKSLPQVSPPTLEKIFSKDHSWTATLSAQKKVLLVATGDIIPARSVNYQAFVRNDFTWAFEKTADFLKDADITFANLESPLLSNCPVTQEGMIFCGSEKHIEGFKKAGIDVVSLANNHAGNWGVLGVGETVELLEKNGIQTTGISGPLYKNIKGTKFAFLGYNDITSPQPGISNYQEDKMKEEINIAKQNSDIVIVTFHWGVEYRSQPDERQKELGKKTIDFGADLVIGNHPHWIQPVEIYQGKLIAYAHGNFIFDQMWSEKTKQGVVGKYIFYGKKLVDVEYFPLFIKDFGQPEFLEGEDKNKILNEMLKESQLINSVPKPL